MDPNELGLRHGKGTRVWANGAKYEGQWVSGVMQGVGIYTSANGQEQYEVLKLLSNAAAYFKSRMVTLYLI